ncbi:hypothetical protein L208DRAFT_1418435 [Tricholoma matsutake]|nr:hypothetical protein L208DRAFT_1418435 [Tricholoma matsutake 945]
MHEVPRTLRWDLFQWSRNWQSRTGNKDVTEHSGKDSLVDNNATLTLNCTAASKLATVPEESGCTEWVSLWISP